MQTKLLEEVIKILNKPMPKGLKFDMNHFWYEVKDKSKCCCVIGLLTTVPSFKKKGLGLEKGVPFSRGKKTVDVRFNGWGGFNAVCQLFGIAKKEYDYMFGGHNPNDRKKAIKRINEVIAGKAECQNEKSPILQGGKK